MPDHERKGSRSAGLDQAQIRQLAPARSGKVRAALGLLRILIRVRLYDVAGSPNCKKVRVLARELGLALELVPVELLQARELQYLGWNPTGKVPTLVDDDGFILWESGAILLYLAERYHGPIPSDPRARADMHRWLFFAATHIQPWLSLLGQERILKARSGQPADVALVALAERELSRFLPVLDAQLANQQFLVRSFSLADIAVGCGLENCEARGVTLPIHVTAWRERLRARPSWSETANAPDAP